MRLLHLICFLCLFPAMGQSQLLIDVGYSPAYTNVEAMEALKQSFNSTRPWLTKELKSFHILHGVHTRIKHRFENWGPWIELNYQLGDNSFRGNQPPNSIATKGKFKTKYLSYLAGLEFEKKAFGIGTGIGRQNLAYRYKVETANTEIDDQVLELNNYLVTLYINLIPAMDSDNISNLVLQPYVNYALSASSFDPLFDYFELEHNPYEERYWQVGLRLIISNGQR